MAETGESALHSTLTDMMTSLMVIFVLLLVNYLKEEQSAVAVARNKTDDLRDELLNSMRLASIDGVDVIKVDDYNIAVIVPEEKLQFDVSAKTLKPEASEFLGKFTPLLLSSFAAFQESISLINVEGHTDKTLRRDAVNQYFNWDLSQERASAVMKYIFESDRDSKRMHDFQEIALFGGRGPIECQHAADAAEELRKRCRTVKFKIRLKSHEESKDA